MTKKSAGRLMRDARSAEARDLLKKSGPNKCWDELKDLHQLCAGLLKQHVSVLTAASDPVRQAAIVDGNTFCANINSVASDLTMLNQELAEISATHLHKSGGSDDVNEIMASFSTAEQYHLFMTRHDALVLPAVNHLAEIMEEADRRVGVVARTLLSPEAAGQLNAQEAADFAILTKHRADSDAAVQRVRDAMAQEGPATTAADDATNVDVVTDVVPKSQKAD
jgi:hypothetical protein